MMKNIYNWLKKNTMTVVFATVMVLVLLLVILGFWFKIRGFKIADLLYKLQILEAKNEINYLESKKIILNEKENVLEKDIEKYDIEIKEEQKKIETAKLKVKGMNCEEIAAELTDLGF